MQEQETTADPYGMTTRKAKAKDYGLIASPFGLRSSLRQSGSAASRLG
jgi:hypothetical protein